MRKQKRGGEAKSYWEGVWGGDNRGTNPSSGSYIFSVSEKLTLYSLEVVTC